MCCLESSLYTYRNAVLWGNCANHFKKAQEGPWKERAVHIAIGLMELPPIFGQIISLFETYIAKCYASLKHNVKGLDLSAKVVKLEEVSTSKASSTQIVTSNSDE